MAFEPTIEGVRRDNLAEYSDELGEVYIGSAGYMPEPGFCFYYCDAKYEFCFYADCKFDGKEFDIDVQNATVDRFRGAWAKIDPEDFDRIRRNMARFFAEHWFLSPSKPLPPENRLRSLKLSWVLR